MTKKLEVKGKNRHTIPKRDDTINKTKLQNLPHKKPDYKINRTTKQHTDDTVQKLDTNKEAKERNRLTSRRTRRLVMRCVATIGFDER